MNLILHIGTPKTGTTAVQRFLHRNRHALTEYGFHQATTPPHNLGHANSIADALYASDHRAVQAFLASHVRSARQRGADTVLISAENFYVRNVLLAMQRGEVCRNALEDDRRVVEKLLALLPDELATCRIVCYFRRPDRYAESLYNQHVKRGVIDGTFDEFLSRIEPVLHYDTCVRSWADVFGRRNFAVRLYDTVKNDVVGDFVTNVLGIQDVAQFSHAHKQENERISRDLLEFKRLKNRTARFSERYLDCAVFHLIEKEVGLLREEPESYQDFLSPDDRAELLRRLQPELDALEASHGVPGFPPFDVEIARATWSPYPGLTRERRKVIELHYDRINARMAFRLERSVTRSAGFLRRTVPGTGVVIDALKRVGAKRAVHGFAVGLQRGIS
jgi:Sulfotransferase domain